MESTQHLDRSQKLVLWRKQTGRTPMKRLSYVQECYREGGAPKPPTTHVSYHPSHFKTPRSKVARSQQPLEKPLTCNTENVPPSETKCGMGEPCEPKLSRKEMLEQWLAIHGSTVKKPRSHLLRNERGKADRPDRRILKRRRTLAAVDLRRGRLSHGEAPQGLRKTLREKFQRDIEDTVAEIYEGDTLATQLGFDEDGVDLDLPGSIDEGDRWDSRESEQIESQQSIAHQGNTPPRKHKTRLYFDAELMFKSTTIRYSIALSEPRKRRHSAMTPDTRRQLHLTPVRRSTRKNRHGPGLVLDQALCFDSPSEATNREEFESIQVVPNRALIPN